MSTTERLLTAVQRGDPEAWSALLERLRPFVTARLRHAAQARNWFWLDDLEDAAQEVLVRFVEALREGRFHYRDEDQLRGFLVRTAFFVAMKRKDDALQRPASDLAEAEGDDVERRFDLAAFAASAYDTLGRRECLQELYAAIDRLQPARREVLRLVLLGLKPREIAPRMERSANAVSVLKFHALEDLREELEAGDFARNCGRYFFGARD